MLPKTAPDWHDNTFANGRFLIIDCLGHGGMGTVYRALDREFGQEVALKTLRRLNTSALQRLKAEFRARAQVNHPNLLPLFELVVSGEQALFSMQLVHTVGFAPWVRAEPHARLRSLLAQLCAALHALHDAGFVHRDVKPDNLLIDDTGHLFLADFDLMTRAANERRLRSAGTPQYMAPEQQLGEPGTAASDMYAVGLVLLEGLTGQVPLSAAGALAQLTSGADRLLVELARDLTQRSPERRPTADALIQRLYDRAPRAAAAPRQAFVGRDEELGAVLSSWQAAASCGRSLTVQVHGQSGIGKSTLLRHVLDAQRAAADVLALEGRCHPREVVDYGAFDDIVDGLAEFLSTLAPLQLELDPADQDALHALFPNLWPSRPSELAAHVERGQLRLRAFAAMRRMLTCISQRRQVVIWIDDLHWADADSLELLEALLAGHGIPGCCFLLSYQLNEAAAQQLARIHAAIGGMRHELALRPLSERSMRSLLRATVDPSALTAELVRGTEGYPIFAQLLAQQPDPEVSAHGDLGDRLSKLINSTVDSLRLPEQRLLDAIAVAAGPVLISVVLRAARIDAAPLSVLALLEQRRLIRRSPHATRRVLLSHERLRQARLHKLDAGAQRDLHSALALAHEQLQTDDYEALAHHYSHADEPARAGAYAVRAGDRAYAALAFGAACQQYAQALHWLGPTASRWELQNKLAMALAQAGHGNQAGPQFEQAARALAQQAGDPDHVMRLHVRAAEQHFRSGGIADGYRITRSVLTDLDEPVPRSRFGALAETLWLRAGFMLRGIPKLDACAARVEREDTRLDMLWTASTSLAHVNHALAGVLLLRYVRRATKVAHASRLARCLTYAGGSEAALGGGFFDRRCDSMLSAAEPWLRERGNEYDRGWYWVSRAAVHYFRAEWSEVIGCCERAAVHLTKHEVGVTWELGVNDLYWLSALSITGAVEKLALRQALALEEARCRGDALAANQCRSGHAATLWLYTDNLEVARREAGRTLHTERARERASWPEDCFSTCDYQNLIAVVQLALYEGDACAAYLKIDSAWPHVRRALLLQVRSIGAEARYLYARAALSASAQLRAGLRPEQWPRAWTAEALERKAARQIRALRKTNSPCALPYAELLQAALERRRAEPRQLAARLDRAAQSFERLSMTVHAAVARCRLAELTASPDRFAALYALGVRRPERIVELFAPQ